MANIRSCNKHNMIACVEKTAQNADFYQIIDFLTGCSINYSLLVDPDLIGPWLQQFWATATLKVINDVPHIRAKVAGKKILISEATIRADLLFDDENGVDCFPKQVIWDVLRDIGYEVLRAHQDHISNGTPFLMYPSIGSGGRTETSPILGLQVMQGMLKALHSKCCSFSKVHLIITYCLHTSTASFHGTVNSQGTELSFGEKCRHVHNMQCSSTFSCDTLAGKVLFLGIAPERLDPLAWCNSFTLVKGNGT
ncbi:hypothetical protein Tco_0140331 [Tanacetum coccineum]